jgi:hypothetical protein
MGPLLLLLVSVLAAPAPSLPQEIVRPGERIRVTIDDDTLVGRLEVAAQDTFRLLVESTDRSVVIPMSRVDRLERSLGSRRHFISGFLVAMIGTAALGAVVGMGWASAYDEPVADGALTVAGYAALYGTPLFVLIGSMPREAWESASWPDAAAIQASVRPLVIGGRVGLKTSITGLF